MSSNVNPDKVTLPKFSTVIVYSIVSPKPNSPSPLSLIDAVLVVSIIGFGFIINIARVFNVILLLISLISGNQFADSSQV